MVFISEGEIDCSVKSLPTTPLTSRLFNSHDPDNFVVVCSFPGFLDFASRDTLLISLCLVLCSREGSRLKSMFTTDACSSSMLFLTLEVDLRGVAFFGKCGCTSLRFLLFVGVIFGGDNLL